MMKNACVRNKSASIRHFSPMSRVWVIKAEVESNYKFLSFAAFRHIWADILMNLNKRNFFKYFPSFSKLKKKILKDSHDLSCRRLCYISAWPSHLLCTKEFEFSHETCKIPARTLFEAALLKKLRKRESTLHVPVYMFSQCLSWKSFPINIYKAAWICLTRLFT